MKYFRKVLKQILLIIISFILTIGFIWSTDTTFPKLIIHLDCLFQNNLSNKNVNNILSSYIYSTSIINKGVISFDNTTIYFNEEKNTIELNKNIWIGKNYKENENIIISHGQIKNSLACSDINQSILISFSKDKVVFIELKNQIANTVTRSHDEK